jgi:hypothetical protein
MSVPDPRQIVTSCETFPPDDSAPTPRCCCLWQRTVWSYEGTKCVGGVCARAPVEHSHGPRAYESEVRHG